METGAFDARNSTFRIVEVTNNLRPVSEEERAAGETDQVRYYLTQVKDNIKMFLVKEPDEEITSFE